jgi:hypothetical protein
VLFFSGEEGKEEHGRDEDVHPDGVEIAHPATGNIFPGEESGAEDQIFYGNEELGIEVGDVGEKMPDDMPEAFIGFEIFLAAMSTISFFDGVPAVEAVFIMSKMVKAHGLFL